MVILETYMSTMMFCSPLSFSVLCFWILKSLDYYTLKYSDYLCLFPVVPVKCHDNFLVINFLKFEIIVNSR